MNKKTKAENKYRIIRRMEDWGFSYAETMALQKIERTLHRWHEMEANGQIQQDESAGSKPRRHLQTVDGQSVSYPMRDLENGALRKLNLIMKNKEGLVPYVQTDCRGCALYILKTSDLEHGTADQIYTRGLPISS